MTHESRFYIRALLDKEVSRAAQKHRFATESIEAWKKQYPSIPVSPILLAGVEMAQQELDDAHAALDDFEQEQKALENATAHIDDIGGVTVHEFSAPFTAVDNLPTTIDARAMTNLVRERNVEVSVHG